MITKVRPTTPHGMLEAMKVELTVGTHSSCGNIHPRVTYGGKVRS